MDEGIKTYLSIGNESVNAKGFRVRRRGPGQVNPKTMWQQVKSLIGDYIDQSMTDVPEQVRARLTSDFSVDMEIVFEAWQSKLNRERSKIKGEKFVAITRTALKDACFRLNMPVPEIGEAIDLDAAKKHMRSLASHYHPDKNKDIDVAPQFRAVMIAYKTIETYNEKLNKQKNRNNQQVAC